MGWILYRDNGPGGPCGQSCSATCSHSILALFPDEDAMRTALERDSGGIRKQP